MKKLFAIAIVLILVSCGSKNKNRGELVGVKGKKWHPEQPYGMTLIPGGSFIMGKSDDDMANMMNAPTRTVSIRSFYMDETEITNSEYRQFVNWVKDSVVRFKLAVLADELGEIPGNGGIGEYAFKDTDTSGFTVYDRYMYDNYVGFGETGYEGRKLNREIELIWDTAEYPDEYYTEVMDSLYIPEEETYNGRRTFDANHLKYQYRWLDIEAAVRAKSRSRKDFIRRENLKIYPDTAVWIRDFNYSYNEPMHNDYFWHEAYSEYPVVGVSWKQAKAFCAWRTKIKNDYQKEKGEPFVNQFRLPTEAEWEYAARGGLESAVYPWGGPYTRDDRGCFLANFKPARGDYAADNALYTVEARSYEPNDYGLYNMAGNVAEWTSSTYNAGSYEMMSTMNPDVYDKDNRRKVIRGGSWKDIAYFLRVSTRDYEYQDSVRSYIGFRTVQDYMGADVISK